MNRALEKAANMVADLWLQAAQADIAGSGNFGSSWTGGLHVTVEGGAIGNYRIAMTHDIPFAGIFETGGVIEGKPLLWIPLSGTDAAGIKASAFGNLFSAKYPRKSGPPLLFSSDDKQPRYFGISSVTIPKKWDLKGDAETVMGNFRAIFSEAMKS